MQTNLQRPQRLFVQPVRYEIPAFQRRYVWKLEEQWEPLWDDVEHLAQSIVNGNRAEAHFMGAIVLQQTQFAAGTIERRIVVDGQQRLTTLQLLIDAIQEVLEDRGHSDPAKRLAALVLNGEEYRNGKPDHAFKVWPTVVDRVAFQHAMSNELSATEYAASRIVQAHEVLQGPSGTVARQIPRRNRRAVQGRQCVGGGREREPGDCRDRLGRLGRSARHIRDPERARYAPPPIGHGQEQGSARRGMGLGDDGSEASAGERRIWPFDQDDWWAQEVGRGLQRRPRVDVYLNHWLTLRNRAEMKPYDEFRAFEKYADARLGEGDTIQDVAGDLGDLGSIYRDIEEMRRADIAKFLERRNVMNVGVVTPLLLWLLSADLAPARLANCLRAVESFLVRRLICGYSARSYGALFVGLMARLAADSADDADRILVSYLGEQTAQATLWPGDKELCDRFITAPLYQYLTRRRLRMVLAGIEEELRTNKAESREVPGGLHIEHVMPQAWHPNWPLPDDITDDEAAAANRDRVIHTIGNLTLVNGRLNSSLSNAPWDSKRETLADHSVLFLNKRLVNKGPMSGMRTRLRSGPNGSTSGAVRIWPHAADIQVG